MDELEKSITKALGAPDNFDTVRAEASRKETVQMFYDNLRNVKIVFWIFMAISLAIMTAGVLGMHYNTGRYVTIALFMALVGFNSTLLMKLWYWTISSRISLLKEIKQLQLQIAELSDKNPSSEG